MGADFVEGAGLTAVKAEAQLKDLAFTLVEHEKHFLYLVG